MADDVEIGIDGSDAESGVKRIIASLDKVGKASDNLAKKAGSDFQKIFDKLKSIGDSSIIAKYERLTGSMERAAQKVGRTHAAMSQQIASNSVKTAASISHMTGSLAKLEGFKGPSKAGVRNVQDLLNAVGSMKTVNTAAINSLASLSGFKGPSGASVKNTQILLQAVSSTKISSTFTRLGILDSISNFKGPSGRSVDNTERLLNVISRARFASGSGLGEAAALLNSIGNAGARLGATTSRVGAATGALQRLNGASRQGATGLAALAQSADRTNQALFHTERFFGTIANVAGLSFIATEIQKFDSSAAAIQTVTNNLAATRSEMSFLTETAKENSTYIGSLTKGYSSFRTAAAGAGLALVDTQSLFAGVTQASRVYNLSLDDQEGVYRALTQIMGKNSLQQEELRGQLGDRMPVAIQAMAKALGVTIPVMNEMTKKGLVSGKVLTDAFARLGPILEDMTKGGFTAAMETIGAKTSQLRTQALLLSVAMGDAGMKGAINNVLGAFTNLITEGGAVYNMLMSVSEAALFLSQNLEGVIAISILALIGKFDLAGKAMTVFNAQMVAMATVSATTAGSTTLLTASQAALSASIIEATKLAAGEIIPQEALSNALRRGTVAAEGSAAANRLLAISMGQIPPAAAAAALGVNAVTASSTTLMRVSNGRQLQVMSSGLGLLAKGARLAATPFQALLSLVGLTNIWLIAAAAIVGLVIAFANMTEGAKTAKAAQEGLKKATDLASSSAFAGAANLAVYTAGLVAMGDEARKTTIALEDQARAMARAQVGQARARLQEFTRSRQFGMLNADQQAAVRGAAESNSYRDTFAFAQAAGNGIKPLAAQQPGLLGAIAESARTNRGIGDIMDRRRVLGAAVDDLSTVVTASKADLQGLAQQMSRTGHSFDEITRATGLTEMELNSYGIASGVVAAQSAAASEKTGKGARDAANRVRPLNMTLEEYVMNLESVASATRTLNAISPPTDGMEVTVDGFAAVSRRLQNLTLETEALKLGSDAWSRYRESLTAAQKTLVETDLADQLKVEASKGVTGSAAQRIFSQSQIGVDNIWNAENRSQDFGPMGASRLRAITDIEEAYASLGTTMRDYRIQLALIGESGLDVAQQEGAVAEARRGAILQYRDMIGIQGQVLSAYDEQVRTLRTLDNLNTEFGLDVTEDKIQAALRYAQALRQIVESTPEGKIQAQLRDNLMGIAEGAAKSMDALMGTYTSMKRYEETVLRGQLNARNGYRAGGDPAANNEAQRLTQVELDGRRTLFEMEQGAARFEGYMSAISSSIDSVGDAFTDFVMGAEVDIGTLAMSITRELTKAFLIEPLLANFKAGIGNFLMDSPLGGFMNTANAAASAAGSVVDQAGAATMAAAATSLSTAGISLNSAGIPLNSAGVALNSAGVALGGSGTALLGAATGLGGAATGLGGSAVALGGSAAALTAAAATMAAAGAASGAGEVLGTALKIGATVMGAPVAHSGGVIGTSALRTRSLVSAGMQSYHSGGLAGLKPREVGAVLKIGEEVLPESSPRHIKNFQGFDGPQRYQQPTNTTVQGDTYEIIIQVQAPTPSGNPQADRRSQEETGKVAAEAFDAMLKQRGDKASRTRSMSVK